jgi:hypothetical protein
MPKKIKDNPVSKYVWDAVKGQYINPETGRVISSNTIIKEVNKVIRVSNKNMMDLSQQLADGSLSLGKWQLAMLEQVKLLHIASAAAGNGGWAQMSQSDWGFIGGRLRQQYKYLANFAKQIKNDLVNTEAPGFLKRVAMYGDAGHATLEQMHRRYEMQSNGMEEEMRELGEADHCDDCLEQAALGWQPIGTLDAIGDTVCKTNCHCTFRYRKIGEDGEWIESE